MFKAGEWVVRVSVSNCTTCKANATQLPVGSVGVVREVSVDSDGGEPIMVIGRYDYHVSQFRLASTEEVAMMVLARR